MPRAPGGRLALFVPAITNLKAAETLALDERCCSAAGTVRSGEHGGRPRLSFLRSGSRVSRGREPCSAKRSGTGEYERSSVRD